MKALGSVAILLLMLAAVVWSARQDRDYGWAIEAGMPLPKVPANNPMSDVKVELGRCEQCRYRA